MRIRPNLRMFGMAAAALIAIAPGIAPALAADRPRSRLIIDPQTAFAMQIVATHNQLRNAESVAPALWDRQLAATADAYAAELARTGRFAHSSRDSRSGQGENLWMGTRGAFSFERMVSDWGSEKHMFRPGRFPDVSTTGRWEDVGHYTQIIWPASTRVGCAVRSSAQYDYLVCHYGETGNVIGQNVGLTGLASR